MAEEQQSEAELPPLKIDETERIIARLEQVVRDRRVVLVGGQAVAIWAAKLEDRIADTLVDAVASRDIDLLGNSSDLRQSAALLNARVRVATFEDRTPLTGVAIFLDSDGHERRLDVMASVYGMNSEDIRQTAIEAELLIDGDRQVHVWVMHPERCMESRVHNSVLSNKQTDLAWRQLRASILCARAFSQLLLDARGAAAVRDVLKLNERIFHFAQEDRCTRLALHRNIETFDAVLDDERLPARFRTVRLPQMQNRIRTLRERPSS
ncbi:MAG TPA: hypothetical protein VFV03_06720 [Solirubrobacteraceae bacterium]|nr:hypothetical protein [Solirubrobacteraceae bacterium]